MRYCKLNKKSSITILLSVILGTAAGYGIGRYLKKPTEKKYVSYQVSYLMMLHWFEKKRAGIDINEYFVQRGYHNIAVYGVGNAGELLLSELDQNKVRVEYLIDRDTSKKIDGYKTYSLDDDLGPVDAIVVSAVHAFDDIECELMQKVLYPIISLDDVIYDMGR